jgi:hypothetical protein
LAPARFHAGQNNFLEEQIMTRLAFTGIGMLAGILIGAAAVGGLNAQNAGPAAYAVVDITEITDPATFVTLLPKAMQANNQFGGKFLTRPKTSSRWMERRPSGSS